MTAKGAAPAPTCAGFPLGRGRMLKGMATAVLALLAGSCASTGRGPAPLPLAAVATRYEQQRDARALRLTAARLDATAWIEGERFGRLPALQMDVALAGPDRVRLRLASLFGTALDLMVRGDSLSAYVPPRRIGFEVASLEESLGVRLAGAWACRAFAATWNPRDPRWVRLATDSLWHTAWLEGGDSLALAIDGRGLPASLELRSASGRALRARYTSWTWIDRVAWPARLEIDEGDGSFRIAMRVDRVRFLPAPDPLWMSLTIPASAERLDWSAVRGAFDRLGERP